MKNSIEDEILNNLTDFTLYEGSENVTNPFTGETANLDQYGASLYDYIINAKMFLEWKKVSVALNIFQKYYPNEFKILLEYIKNELPNEH